MQVVFQDPLDALDPRQRVKDAIEEPLARLTQLNASERNERVVDLARLVHLSEVHLRRRPHELSGGQQQRVGIARALATYPKLVVLDEPTSALDWPIRADILELLRDLRTRMGLSYFFISHDFSAVQYVCDRVAVMYLGKVVEEAPTESLLKAPAHPYTKALLSSILDFSGSSLPERLRLQGEPVTLVPATGCPLSPRCPIAVARCAETPQELVSIGQDHRVACMRVSAREAIEWPTSWDLRGTKNAIEFDPPAPRSASPGGRSRDAQ